MYRSGKDALDEQIAATVAAIGHAERMRALDAHLLAERTSLRERIAELEAMAEEHGSQLSFGHLWALLRGRAGDERMERAIARADVDIMLGALDHQLGAVEARRREVAAELAGVAGAAEHLEQLLAKKQAWLEETGAPGSSELLDVARVIGRLRGVDRCLVALVDAACEMQSQLLQAITYFEDANDPASRARGSRSSSGSRQGQLDQAAVHASMAEMHRRAVFVELRNTADACRDIDFELPEQLAGADTAATPATELSLRQLRSDESVISDIISAATRARGHIAQRLAELDERRRRLLGAPG